MSTGVIQGRAIARSGTALLARVTNASAANVTQSSLSAISYQVRDIEAATSGSVHSLTISDVISDTLQTGNGWDQDTTGYNFRVVLPATSFVWTPEIDAQKNPIPRRFQVDVKFTPATGEPFIVVFGVWVSPVWIS